MQKWNANLTKLLPSISILLSISLFLFITSDNKFPWIFLSVLSFLILLSKPTLLIMSFIVFAAACLIFSIFHQSSFSDEINESFKVKGKISMGPIVRYKNQNILIKTKWNVNVGDLIHVKGKILPVYNNSDFDLKNYLNSHNIKSFINYSKIEILEKTNDFRIPFKNYINSGPDAYKKVTPLLFLGMKTSLTKDIYNISIKMNIVHLFVISGFHISIFALIMQKILIKIKLSEILANWISLIPILLYLFILDFPISATRAAILTFLTVINKSFLKNKYNSLSILAITMGIMFIWKPWSVSSLSFIFSFIATHTIMFFSQVKFQRNWTKILVVYTTVYSSNLIIILYNNHYFSVFGIFISSFMSPLFVFMYVSTIVLFPFKNVLGFMDNIFMHTLYAIDKINLLIDIPTFNVKYVYFTYGFILFTILIIIPKKRSRQLSKNFLYN